MPGDVRMLVELLAKNLVEAPDSVFVDVYDEDGGVEIELEVAEDDMGRVIGRSGRTARCLRTITANFRCASRSWTGTSASTWKLSCRLGRSPSRWSGPHRTFTREM